MELECAHMNSHYEDWPDGGQIEVCEDCRMSCYHWEWGDTHWLMIDDIEGARKALQKSIDKILK